MLIQICLMCFISCIKLFAASFYHCGIIEHFVILHLFPDNGIKLLFVEMSVDGLDKFAYYLT